MYIQDAQREANLRNVFVSTGLEPAERNDTSRADALKQGLCSASLVAEDLDAIKSRTEDWYWALKPQNLLHGWMVGQVSVISLRLDRNERMERRVRDKIALRAELSWDDDRELEAANLGDQISRRPRPILTALRRTVAGCSWLLEMWAMLAYAADLKTSWSPDQVKLAFDLLATPAEFREGFQPGAVIDSEGRVIDDGKDQAAVARARIAELKKRREFVRDFDEIDRNLARVDLHEGNDPELKKLRRHEGSLQSNLRWFVAQIQSKSPFKEPNPVAKPEITAQPDPRDESPDRNASNTKLIYEPLPDIPFTLKPLEPHEMPEPGMKVDVAAILKARERNEAKKQDQRRNKRRRNLEKLRG